MQAANPAIPIMILSGFSDQALAVQAVQNGAQDYLVKGQGQPELLTRSIRYAIERKRAEERLTYLAQYDQLTGLVNRTLFRDRLIHAMARSKRLQQPMGLMLLDLDRFKSVNLVKVAENTVEAARFSVDKLVATYPPQAFDTPELHDLHAALEHYIGLASKVLDQTRRRVFDGETVPAPQKIVSIFEPHTDIIRKDRRDTLYGHKVFLTAGAPGLIVDCIVERGNPRGVLLNRSEAVTLQAIPQGDKHAARTPLARN